MTIGIICGFITAILNSVGYLCSANFLKRYRSPIRLLLFAHIVMMLPSIPVFICMFPFTRLADPGSFCLSILAWIVVFVLGQGSFFMALKHCEASRLSSLLGLKIIVLTVIFMLAKHHFPNIGQWTAVFMAGAAAMLINWTGSFRMSFKGWFFTFSTLVFYSLCDINETNIVLTIVNSGYSGLKGSIISASAIYTVLGLVSLPGLFFLRPTKKQFLLSAPYALLWLSSQIFLMTCFAMVLPVFGNVILASRGLVSVILGAMLSLVGLQKLDAVISRKQWILRAVAAILMIGAIAVYSFSSQK